MTVDCVSLHTSGAKLQIISICDKKITKNNPESVLCVIFMQKTIHSTMCFTFFIK